MHALWKNLFDIDQEINSIVPFFIGEIQQFQMHLV